MESDLKKLSGEDLKLLFETFSVIRSGNYEGSEVQLGFKNLFQEADTNGDGYVEKSDFHILIEGYLNSKHIKIKQDLVDSFFMKIDLNQDNRISFEEYDIFVRMVYETEYLPAILREIQLRA